VETPSSALPLEYVGGDPSLDLVNTVTWTARGIVHERLTSYDRLVAWAQGAAVVSGREADRLRRRARLQPRAAAAVLGEAKDLRGVLHALFAATARGEQSAAVWREFNARLAGVLRRLRLAAPARRRAGVAAEWTWSDPARLDAVLWRVAWSAARLLVSDEAARLRTCGGVDCGWMYVDRSRNRLRRWCDMRTCGTAEKSRRRRQKAGRPTVRSSRRET
jgi:predicted RNA-binding Zn ribbon-like protein